MLRFPIRSLALLAAVVSLGACETTERVADTAAEGIEDGAEAVAGVAVDVADAVADAAGTVYDTAEDVFTDDPDATAVALVRPTSAPGASAQGTVRFRESGDGLTVAVSLQGLTPGEHGFHVHTNPSCDAADSDGDGRPDPAGAADGHWDPLSTMDHGAPNNPLEAKHVGDFGNVTVGADGTVETTVTVPNVTDEYAMAGHAVVVHSGTDDLETGPSGDSGTPMGCGVIEGR